MRISILTVTYNSAETLGYTLDSFCEQEYADKELIIIDGASTDNTLEVISRYPQEKIRVLSEPDNGMYDALNKGLGLYTGDAVGVLNSDDCYHDEHVLTKVAEQLQHHQCVHGHLDFVIDHEAKRIVRRWRGRPMSSRRFRSGWMPAHPTFYVTRELAEATGPFDTTFKIASDYDWMMRAVEHYGKQPGLIRNIMVDMQQGGMSTSGVAAQLRHNKEAYHIRRKNLQTPILDYALIAKPMRKIRQWLPSIG